MCKELSLDHSTLVIELASNDGYLLSEFKKLNVPVLGVEPASNVAEIAENSGVPTIVEFFGAKEAELILEKYGHPRLIVANNVFAHIPDLQDFTKGISILSDENTITTIENPSFFVRLLENSLFDTIYHEHYSYHTAHSVKNVVQKFNLHLIRVEELSTHGGSNRYWISRKNNSDNSVIKTLRDETNGLFDELKWNSFAEKIK